MDTGSKKTYAPGESYDYQLLIRHILESPRVYSPDREIIYRDRVRLTYRDFFARTARLANALAGLGVGFGDTVCVFDYDSHRYLECFFAIR